MVSAAKAIGSSVVTSTATRPDQGAIFRGHCSAPCSAPAKRDGHISRCGGPHALAIYLLLVTVGDSQSLSYYSDKTAARLLGLSQAELRQARNHLLGVPERFYRRRFSCQRCFRARRRGRRRLHDDGCWPLRLHRCDAATLFMFQRNTVGDVSRCPVEANLSPGKSRARFSAHFR